MPRIDRIAFRAKDSRSFAVKALKTNKDGSRRYPRPLDDLEDQVAGRALVFFRRDIEAVEIHAAEGVQPRRTGAQGSRRRQLLCLRVGTFRVHHSAQRLPAWSEKLASPPTTFEMQIRTLFMHAWAEPQHDIMYKAKTALSDDNNRRIAWAASNAWGGDAIFEQVLDAIAGEEPANNRE